MLIAQKLKCKSSLDILIKIKNLYIIIPHVEIPQKNSHINGQNIYTKMLFYRIVLVKHWS